MKIVVSAILLFIGCFHHEVSSQEPSAAEQEYFIKQIFSLYGNEKQLSFEGLEHLMENLGLGGLKFDKKHNISMHKNPDGSFAEVHDKLNLHSHNHTHSRQERSISKPDPETGIEEKCLSPESLLSLYGLEPGHRVSITHQGFMRICPAIVYQLDRRACLTPDVLLQFPNSIKQSQTAQAWVGASLSILAISIAGMIGVSIVPYLQRQVFHHLLSTLVAVAVGTLCGDALLHLLPHAYGVEENEQTLLMSSTAYLSLIGFFVVEAVIHIIHEYKQKRKEEKKKNKLACEEMDYAKVFSKDIEESDHEEEHGHSHGSDGVQSVAWMIVSGDGLHNLTDGLAVGAAFRADLVSGLATAIAVLSHELPHEIGDFAVLLKSGMTVKQALFYNVVSSVLSFIGMTIGVMMGSLESATSWIYCVAAGSFLYIGLGDLIPELHKNRRKGKGKDVITILIFQLLGMFIGGGIMFLLALYEHDISDMLKKL